MRVLEQAALKWLLGSDADETQGRVNWNKGRLEGIAGPFSNVEAGLRLSSHLHLFPHLVFVCIRDAHIEKLPCLEQLRGLRVLDAGSNRLTGPVPSCLKDMVELRELRLDHNKLEGGVPSLSKLKYLKVLCLQGNRLQLCCPGKDSTHEWGLSSLMEMPSLKTLDVSWNSFSSSELPREAQLTILKCRGAGVGEGLGGALPRFCGYNLVTLDLCRQRLSGSIPASLLSGSPKLAVLRLRGNRLTGQVPPEVTALKHLRELDLGINQLEGEIPAGMGDLTSLELLDLSRNNLEGYVPLSLVGLCLKDTASLHTLSLQHNPMLRIETCYTPRVTALRPRQKMGPWEFSCPDLLHSDTESFTSSESEDQEDGLRLLCACI